MVYLETILFKHWWHTRFVISNNILETLLKNSSFLFLKEIVLKLLKTLLEISVSSQLKCENTYKLPWEILSSLITFEKWTQLLTLDLTRNSILFTRLETICSLLFTKLETWDSLISLKLYTICLTWNSILNLELEP